MKRIFVGNAGATVGTEVFVALERLHAEWNEAQAEDPASNEHDQ